MVTAGGVIKDGMWVGDCVGWSWLSMPTHVPTELKLDVPICEEDIGDLSPYSVPLSGLRTTINSSYSTIQALTRHEVVSGVPYSGNDIHRMLVLETPMRGVFDVGMCFIL
jgi:hypothetical protein